MVYLHCCSACTPMNCAGNINAIEARGCQLQSHLLTCCDITARSGLLTIGVNVPVEQRAFVSQDDQADPAVFLVHCTYHHNQGRLQVSCHSHAQENRQNSLIYRGVVPAKDEVTCQFAPIAQRSRWELKHCLPSIAGIQGPKVTPLTCCDMLLMIQSCCFVCWL
jgi:hypothetical protein